MFCQVCQDDITALSTDQRTAHVNACIDGTSKKPERRDVTDAGSGVSEEKETCHICQRDISEFNSHRRQLHVNYCVDKVNRIYTPIKIGLRGGNKRNPYSNFFLINYDKCVLCANTIEYEAISVFGMYFGALSIHM